MYKVTLSRGRLIHKHWSLVCGALMHVAPPNCSLFTTMSFIRGAFLLVTCIGSIAIGIWQGHAILFSPQLNPVYGPNPILFALLVLAQSMLQVFWLWKVYLRESALAGEAKHLPEAKVEEVNNSGRYNAELLFSPILVIEYICLIAWHFSWRKENFIRCEIISMFNTAIHLFTVYWLFPQTCDSAMVSEGTARTRLLTRTSTGIAFLYMWKVWGVIDEAIAPAISQRLQTGAVFILLTISSGPEPTLGLCLLCNLIVMILGPCQIPEWRKAFICTSMAIAVVVVLDCFMNGRRQGVMLDESSEESVEESHALVEFRVPS